MWGMKVIGEFPYVISEILGGCAGRLTSNFIRTFRKDLTSGYYSEEQVTTALDQIKAQDNCDPIEFDFKDGAKEAICDALRAGEMETARKAVDDGASVIARPWCMDLVKASCTFICSCGPKIIREATFNLLDC